MVKNSQVVMLFIIMLLGCHGTKQGHSSAELKRVEDCSKTWVFKDIVEEQTITVYLFNEKNRIGLQSFPNFIIGTNTQGDTVGVLDWEYEGKLSVTDVIHIKSGDWTSSQKALVSPPLYLYPTVNVNDLYCSISTVYFGRIKD